MAADFFHIFSFITELVSLLIVFFFLAEPEQVIQGRLIRAADVALIAGWLLEHRGWDRTRLSRELCVLWNWRNGAGRLKDMAA